MHRLFWKIFLSFWVALALFSAATLLATSQYLERVRAQRAASSPYAHFLHEVAAAQHAAQERGLEGLRAWARRADRRDLVPLLVVDREGRDVLGRSVGPVMRQRLRHRALHEADHRFRGRHPRPVVVLPDGRVYRLIPDFQSVTLTRILSRPRALALPLIIAALIAGLVCLLLARYLTAPLGRLRHATEAYAAGDLDHRVAPSLGRRRDEIADLARAFDHMAQRLQELMNAQRQLLRDVSHELRSPLARLEAALGLARQRSGAQATGELDRIELETERLNELIGQVLTLSRFESATVPPEREPVPLDQLLQTVASDADFEARTRGRSVRITDHAPATVQANPGLLHSAIENVVRNAVRYTAEGTAVELSLRRNARRPGWVTLEVRDHGPGVPAHVLPHLFEPFIRVGDARDRASGGFGLGLAIADRAVRLHGGRIAARNAAQGGLCVTMELPTIEDRAASA